MDIKDLKKYIFDNNKIEYVLEYYKFHSIWYTGDEIRCAPPDGDNRTSVSIRQNETLFAMYYSDSTPFKGDLIGLIQKLLNTSFRDILIDIHAILGLSISGSRTKSKRSDLLANVRKYKKKNYVVKENKLHNENFLSQFAPFPHPDLYKEAILPKVANQFNISFDPKQNRLIFPHYDWVHHDKIVGVQGRATGLTTEQANTLGIPKYWNYIKGYRKSMNLFGWNHTYKNLEKSKKLILFEAEKSTLKHFSYLDGEGYAVSLGGHELSDQQVAFIIKNTPDDCEIIIAFDKDIMVKDKEYLIECAKRFSKYRKASYIYDKIDNGKILGEKDSPIDNGYLVFKYLMESRETV